MLIATPLLPDFWICGKTCGLDNVAQYARFGRLGGARGVQSRARLDLSSVGPDPDKNPGSPVWALAQGHPWGQKVEHYSFNDLLY